MKTLLFDENINYHLRPLFQAQGFHVTLLEEVGFKGFKNGRLLAAADGRFDVLITRDKHVPQQNNLTGRRLAV